MSYKTIDNQIVRLKLFQKANRLSADKIAESLEISISLLYKLYSGERNLTQELEDKIVEYIKNNSKENTQFYTESHTDDRISTLQEEMMKTFQAPKESPEYEIYRKIEYLKQLTVMREKDELTDEEFIKIKAKLIELL